MRLLHRGDARRVVKLEGHGARASIRQRMNAGRHRGLPGVMASPLPAGRRAFPMGGGLGYLRSMTDWTAFDRLLASRRRPIVESFVDFLRLNSVSQEPDKVRATGEWLAAALRARGLEGRILETGGNPAVFGERRVPGAARTVLIYCHYDTKPIPLKGWLQPNPIEPVFRRGLAEAGAPPVELAGIADDDLAGLLLHARGASDDKGPIWCSPQRAGADGHGGARPGGQREVHLRRRGGDREPVLRPLHRGPSGPARRRRRHRDGRAQARQRAPHHRGWRARGDEDRAGAGGGPARRALGELRRPQPRVEAQRPPRLHGYPGWRTAHRGLRGGRRRAHAGRAADDGGASAGSARPGEGAGRTPAR